MGHIDKELSLYNRSQQIELIQLPYQEKLFRVTQFLEDVDRSEELQSLPDKVLFEQLGLDEEAIGDITRNQRFVENIFINLSRSGVYGVRYGDWVIHRTGDQIRQKEKRSENRTKLIRGARGATIGIQVGFMIADAINNGTIPEGELIMSTGLTLLFWDTVDVIREDPYLRKLMLLSVYKEIIDRSFFLKSERRVWKFDDYKMILGLLEPDRPIRNEEILELITVHAIIHESLNSIPSHFNQMSIARHVYNNSVHRFNFPSTLSRTNMRERREVKLNKVLMDLYFNILNSRESDHAEGEEEYILSSRNVRRSYFLRDL